MILKLLDDDEKKVIKFVLHDIKKGNEYEFLFDIDFFGNIRIYVDTYYFPVDDKIIEYAPRYHTKLSDDCIKNIKNYCKDVINQKLISSYDYENEKTFFDDLIIELCDPLFKIIEGYKVMENKNNVTDETIVSKEEDDKFNDKINELLAEISLLKLQNRILTEYNANNNSKFEIFDNIFKGKRIYEYFGRKNTILIYLSADNKVDIFVAYLEENNVKLSHVSNGIIKDVCYVEGVKSKHLEIYLTSGPIKLYYDDAEVMSNFSKLKDLCK